MWAEGENLYWDGKEEERERGGGKGIVVMFGWTSITSVELLNKFAFLYASLGWKSLICSPPFIAPWRDHNSPLDCTSEVGARFALNPVVHKAPGATKLVSWMVKWFTYGSDALFLTKFESQNNQYWKTLYSSLNLGAPVLFLCSENDDLAPCRVICNYARCLEDLGADIELVKWNDSPHLGHYENHTSEYGDAVALLLEKAATVFSSRIQRQVFPKPVIEETDDEIPELICHLQKAAGLGMRPSDSSFKPQTGMDDCSQDEQKERSSNLPSTSSSTPYMSAHSVLGQALFDACVPKNIEGWYIRFSGSLNGQPFASVRRLSPLKSIRWNRRSRL